MSTTPFPPRYPDEGPTAMVDMLVGLHAALAEVAALTHELAREEPVALPLGGDGSVRAPEHAARASAAPPPESLVEALLGAVSLGNTMARAVATMSAPTTPVEPPGPPAEWLYR